VKKGVDKKFWNPEMETMDPQKMRTLQEERFLSIVRWAYKKTPFYRRKFDQIGVSPSDIRSLDDIHKIPFTYKDELRESQEKMPPYGEHCASPERIYQTYWSTGTTGRPTFMGVSYKEARYWVDVIARSLFSCGLRRGDLFHHATQLSSFAGGYGFLWGAQVIGANIIPAGAGNTERHLWLISTLKPNFIKILPSYANYVAEAGYKKGIDMSVSSIERIYFSAEPSPPDFRRDIERKWGAITYDSYGLSDVGQPQSYECDVHDGHHAVQDWCLTEIVDSETKEPIQEEGKEGVLVYTNLVRKTMPIIRFWTNDLSSWRSPEPCVCGRTSPRIDPVYCRVDDVIKVKGVNFWPGAVWTVLGGQKELAGTHRIFVESRRGKDYLRIVAELKERAKPDTQKRIDALKSKFQAALFIKVDEIELVPFGSLEAGEHKGKTLVDLRKEK
jgi:phenylacetate-CoA ligase